MFPITVVANDASVDLDSAFMKAFMDENRENEEEKKTTRKVKIEKLQKEEQKNREVLVLRQRQKRLAERRKQRLLDRKREPLPIDLMQIEFTKSHHYSYFAVNILPFCVNRGASKDNTKIIYPEKLKRLVKNDASLSDITSIENSMKVAIWALLNILLKISRIYGVDHQVILEARCNCIGMFEVVRMQVYVWCERNRSSDEKLNLILARALFHLGTLYAQFNSTVENQKRILDIFEEGALVLGDRSHATYRRWSGLALEFKLRMFSLRLLLMFLGDRHNKSHRVMKHVMRSHVLATKIGERNAHFGEIAMAAMKRNIEVLCPYGNNDFINGLPFRIAKQHSAKVAGVEVPVYVWTQG